MLLASSRWAACALALLSLLPATAHAQSAGFAINRFDPAERGSDWFSADSLDLRGHGRLMLGATGDFGEKPLVLYNRDGDELKAIIEHQLYVHVGGSQPEFTTSGKTFTDLNGDPLLPGDVIEYTVTVTNTGNDASANTVLTDALPAGVTYVPQPPAAASLLAAVATWSSQAPAAWSVTAASPGAA